MIEPLPGTAVVENTMEIDGLHKAVSRPQLLLSYALQTADDGFELIVFALFDTTDDHD